MDAKGLLPGAVTPVPLARPAIAIFSFRLIPAGGIDPIKFQAE